jgi:lactose/L-arabinose transport system substrate-binding protein
MDRARTAGFAPAVVAVALALIVSACGAGGATLAPSAAASPAAPSASATPSAVESAAPSASPALSGSITVWSWDIAAQMLTGCANDFTAANPGVKVDVTDVGYDNAYDKISVGLQSGSGLPDVVTVETDHMGGYIGAFPDGFVDLAPRAAQYKDQFDPSKWSASSDAKGRLLSLPWDSGTAAIFYRRDIFEAADVNADSIQTWDDFVAAGEKVKAKTGKAILAMDISGGTAIYDLLLQQLGAGYFTPDGAINVSGAQSTRVMNLLKTLNDKGLVYNAQGWDGRVSALKEGKSATWPTGVWLVGTLTSEMPELSGKFGVIPLPAFDAGGIRTSNSGGSTLAIPSTSKNQDLAWSFMEFCLANTTEQISMMKTAGAYPAYMPAYDDPYLQAPQPYFADQKIYTVFGPLTKEIPAITYTSDNSRASDQMANTQAAILLKGDSIKAALDEAAKALSNATKRPIAP